jgi:hypothetical protein
MNDSNSSQTAFESRLSFGRVLSILGFCGVLAVAGVLYFNANYKTKVAKEEAERQAIENAKLQTQMANLQAAMSDLKTSKVYEQQEQAITKSNAISILERGEILRQDILRFAEAREKTEATMSSLMNSEAGRRIASDVELVALASQSLSIAIPNKDAAPTLLARLDSLLSVPKQAMEQNVAGYKPGESLNQSFSELEQQCKEQRSIVDRVQSDLQALTKKAAELPANQEIDLQQAIAQIEEIKEQQRSAIIAQARDAAKFEGAKLLAAQEAENERILAEAKTKAAQLAGAQMAEKIVADATAEKIRQDAERKAQEAAMEKAKLEQDFQRDLPEIRNYLTNYLSDGYELRNGGKGPASLTVLRGTPIFQPGRRGLEAIIHYGSNKNDRPRGPIDRETGGEYGWKIANKDALTKVQSLLIKYADLLVEKGMLAP